MQTTDRVADLMRDLSARPLAIHLYDLVVSKNGAEAVYATIGEVHHPDYLNLEQLRAIYGTADPQGQDAQLALDQLLATVQEKMN
jgi:hydroxymethylpyrimidine pyrophosphatase-like HAD family hydrolase